MLTLYLLAIVALLIGTAAIYMTMIRPFPVEWLYYHYFIRKPVVWAIFTGTVIWAIGVTMQTGVFPSEKICSWGVIEYDGVTRAYPLKGEMKSDLKPIALSDEYWFSWKLFHSESKLIRV